MPRNQGTSRKGKPGKVEKAAGMGRSLLMASKYRPRHDGKNIYGGSNGMAAIPGVMSIGMPDSSSHVGGAVGTNPNGDTDNNNNNNNNRTLTTTSTLTTTTGTHPRSILDMDDLDDFLYQANLAEREFFSDRGGGGVAYGGGGGGGGGGGNNTRSNNNHNNYEPIQIIDPHRRGVHWANTDDPSSGTPSTTTSTTVVMELSVPRRPPWTHDMSRDELEQQERMAFLEWRRNIAHYEAAAAANNNNNIQNTNQMNPTNSSMISTTPFEKNIHVWKQLWRVLERSNVIVQIIDGRNPLFYLSYDLYRYATLELRKPMIVLINKSDYLSVAQRKIWKHYFTTMTTTTASTTPVSMNDDNSNDNNNNHHQYRWTKNCKIIFFSAMREQKKLDVAASMERKRIINEQQVLEQQENKRLLLQREQQQRSHRDDDDNDDSEDEESNDDVLEENDGRVNKVTKQNDDTVHDDDFDEEEIEHHDNNDHNGEDCDNDDDEDVRILSRDELLKSMRSFAMDEHHCRAEERYDYRIQYGMVGFPNVGKSSVINVLSGASKHTHNTVRVAVASQPGKTKHFQTVLLHDQSDIMLCDCPGLVFPSFVSNTADLIAAGVYPIAQMRDHWPVSNLICQRIPRNILNAHYGISLPVLSRQQLQDRGYDTITATIGDGKSTNDALPPPTAEELLTTYCVARGLLASFSGVPDYQRAARLIIKDYADGKLLYCHPPPDMTADEMRAFYSDTVQTALRNTQRTRERLLKQQEKLQQQQQLRIDGTSKNSNKKQNTRNNKNISTSSEAIAAIDVFDDDLIQMIAASTLPTSSSSSSSSKTDKETTTISSSHKRHNNKNSVQGGAKWGKKDRKNRNKDPYGCHTATPDGTLMSMM